MGGRSSTSQAVSSTDNRRVIGQNGISNEGGSVTVSNYSLDAEVANRAFGAISDNNRAAFSFGSDALGLGAHAIDANGRVVSGALDFGANVSQGAFDAVGRSQTGAFNFGTDAMAGAFGSVNAGNTRAINFATDALASNSDAFRQALQFTANTTNAALSNVQATQQLTANAYADAKGRGALTDKMMIGAIVAMAVVALMAVEK